MKDITQVNRWTKGEMELIKNTFSGQGEELLYNIRDVLYGFTDQIPPLSKDVLDVIKKMILPELSPEAPFLGQSERYSDMAGLFQIPPDVAYIHIAAKDKAIEYLTQRLSVLEGKTVDNWITLQELKEFKTDREERVINMLSYVWLTNSYIETQLVNLKSLANAKEMTEEEKKKEEKMNSTK